METNNQPSPSSSSSVPKIIGVILAILVCCSCALILGAGGVIYQAYQQQSSNLPSLMTPFIKTPIPQATPQLERPPADTVSRTTLDTLEQTNVPENDPYELACRLQGSLQCSRDRPGKDLQGGRQGKILDLNSDTTEHRQVDATLRYITPHSYFWAEDGTDVNESDMKR